jgi:type II secretory pathway pseudopilin PulG
MTSNRCYPGAALLPNTFRRQCRGLSLLEVIIATAVLAGSGMVLFSIIGLGAKYARQAEELTLAHHYAQSVLDEWLAAPSSIGNDKTETLEENPQWSYRISSKNLTDPLLVEVTIEIFQSSTGDNLDQSQDPIYRLQRWTRISDLGSNAVGDDGL